MLEHFQDLQIRPQYQRLQILELLNDMMLQHRQALREMRDEFVIGVMDLVSGEKDPRNLMIIFSVLKAVMLEWDISDHAEVGHLRDISKKHYAHLQSVHVRLRVLLFSHNISASPR